ncbi:MAG: TRAP transporter small permease subunit [Myxococcales bacterium]|nr:TRAP transporter small permease subunit [Myxococcales bacterium]
MQRLLSLAAPLDRLSAATGRAVSWLSLLMVLLGAFNALARYLGRFASLDLSSNAYIELQWYLFSALFLLGAADTLRKDGHVRVDVFYGRLPPRGRAAIDLAGTLLLLIPFCVLVIYMSWPAVLSSWQLAEQSPDPGGLPRYPIKTLIPLCFALLILQALSEALKALSRIINPESPEPQEPPHGR